jgi:hypothetical protein
VTSHKDGPDDGAYEADIAEDAVPLKLDEVDPVQLLNMLDERYIDKSEVAEGAHDALIANDEVPKNNDNEELAQV